MISITIRCVADASSPGGVADKGPIDGAEVEHGAALEMATPERRCRDRGGGTTFSVHLRALYGKGARLSPDLRLRAVGRKGNALVAELRNDYTLKAETLEADQVVAEHGSSPRDYLCFALKRRTDRTWQDACGPK